MQRTRPIYLCIITLLTIGLKSSAQTTTVTPLSPIYEDRSLEDVIIDQNGAFIIHDYEESYISIDEGLSWDTIAAPNNLRPITHRFQRLADGSYLFINTDSDDKGTIWVSTNNQWTPLEVEGDTLYNLTFTTTHEDDLYLISNDKILKYNSTTQQTTELSVLSNECDNCKGLRVAKNRIFLELYHRYYFIYDKQLNLLGDAYLSNFHVTDNGRIVSITQNDNGPSRRERSIFGISVDNGQTFEKILELENAVTRFETIKDNKLYFRYLRYKTEAWSNGHIQSKIGCLNLDNNELTTFYDGLNKYYNNALYSANNNIYHNLGAAIIKYEDGDFSKRVVIKSTNEQITGVKKLRRSPSGELYAMTPTFLYRSLDEGQSWEMIFDHFTAIDFDLDTSGYLHVISNERLYKSEDKGLSFEWIPLTTERTFVDSMQIDFPNTIVIYKNNTILINGKNDQRFVTNMDVGCYDCWTYYPFASYTKSPNGYFWRLSSYLIDPDFYKSFPHDLFYVPLNHALWSNYVVKTKYRTISTYYNSFTVGGAAPRTVDDGDDFGFNLYGQLIHRSKTETRYSENYGSRYSPMAMAPVGGIFPSSDSSSFFVIGEYFHYLKDVSSEFERIRLIDTTENKELIANRHGQIYTDGIEQYLINGGLVYKIDPVQCYETDLSGQFYFDENKNCTYDAEQKITASDSLRIIGDKYAINLKIEKGKYQISLPPGQWKLQPLLSHPKVTTCETEITIDLANPQTIIQDFAIQPITNCPPTIITEIATEICAGETFEGYEKAGNFSDTFLTIDGCDSTRQLSLAVLPSYDTLVNIYLCDGDVFNGVSYTYEFDVNNQDTWSYNKYELRPQTLQTISGCDSIVTYDIYAQGPFGREVEYITICEGEAYQGFTEEGYHIYNNNYSGCTELQLTVTAPYSIEEERAICEGEAFDGYTSSGTYEDLFLDERGCDSTRILHLVVSDQKINNITIDICEGDVYEGYSTPGNYTDVFPSFIGCDSVRNLDLNVFETQFYQYTREICHGSSYLGHKESGIYIDTSSQGPCGLISELTLIVNENSYSYETISICQGDSYRGFDTTGIHEKRIPFYDNAFGCDSFVVIDLTVLASIKDSIDVEICSGANFQGHTTTGRYETVVESEDFCDTTRTINLTVLPSLSQIVNAEICSGEDYEGYNASGIYEDVFSTSSGCDSTRTLELTVTPPQETYLEFKICQGETLEGYTSTGTYEDLFIGIDGCDSTRILKLTVLATITEFMDIHICEGEEFEGHHLAGTYESIFIGEGGCDSIRILELSVQPTEKEYIQIQACEGESVEGYTSTGIYEDLFEGHNGCDSTRTLDLTVLPKIIEEVNTSICQGAIHEGYNTTGTFEDYFTSSNGCDSTRILNLEILKPSDTIISHSVCEGQSLEGYSDSGSYHDVFTNSTGCDSIRTLELTVLPKAESYEEIFLCVNEEYEGNRDPGTYEKVLKTAQGCDSLRRFEIVRIAQEDPVCAYQYDRSLKLFEDTDFINVYPNPIENSLKLIIDQPNRLLSELTILSIDKRLMDSQIITERETTFDVSSYPQGAYILILKNGHNNYMQKVVKI